MKFLFLILTVFISRVVFGQGADCLRYSHASKTVIKEYQKIKSDSVLVAARFFYNSQYTLRFMCWKKGGKNFFKQFEEFRNGKQRVTTKISKERKQVLTTFFDNRIYAETGAVEGTQTYITSHCTVVNFLFVTPADCWKFRYKCGYSNSEDVRLLYAEDFLKATDFKR